MESITLTREELYKLVWTESYLPCWKIWYPDPKHWSLDESKIRQKITSTKTTGINEFKRKDQAGNPHRKIRCWKSREPNQRRSNSAHQDPGSTHQTGQINCRGQRRTEQLRPLRPLWQFSNECWRYPGHSRLLNLIPRCLRLMDTVIKT